MQSTDGQAFCFGRNLQKPKVSQMGNTGNFLKVTEAEGQAVLGRQRR